MAVMAFTGASAPEAEGALTWPNPAYTANGLPLKGQTLLGAAMMGDVEPFEASLGGALGVRRSYFSATQQSGATQRAAEDLAAGRVPWISFKAPYSWADMATGKGDAWAKDLANRLGSLGGPVWVAVEHEPEGHGSPADWKAMQKRLGPIFRAKPNIAYSIILMGWYQFFSDRTEYSMSAFWPGKSNIDIFAIDPYNWYDTTSKSGGKKYTWDELKRYYDAITSWLASTGNSSVRWAVAEAGYTDSAANTPQNHVAPNGTIVSPRGPGSEWLARAYDDMKAMGGIALSYFNVAGTEIGEPADWTWAVSSNPKLSVFSRLLSRSNRITDAAAPSVGFRGATTTNANATAIAAEVPAATKAGDALVMFATVNSTASISTPPGWTRLGSKDDESLRTVAYTRTATAADATAAVPLSIGVQSKVDVTILAYGRVGTTAPVAGWASTAEDSLRASHTAPGLSALPGGGVVVHYWADKSSTTLSWSTPGEMSKRTQSIGAGSGRITSASADASVPVAGTWPTTPAVASSASGKATMWTIALSP